MIKRTLKTQSRLNLETDKTTIEFQRDKVTFMTLQLISNIVKDNALALLVSLCDRSNSKMEVKYRSGRLTLYIYG